MGCLFKLAVECFNLLAWPFLAFGYPLWASIQAIETNSISDIRKLIAYWVCLSLIFLFENAFFKLLEWLLFWYFIKLILVGFLVIHHFDGSLYVYKRIIHPCLRMDPQVIINELIKMKEFFLEKYELLVLVEKDVKENGADASENLIAFKPNFEVNKVAKKDIDAVEMTEQKNITSTPGVGQMKSDLAPAVDRISAPLEIKETIAAMVLGRDFLPQTPHSKNIQKEWDCPVCQVTTTNETVFISHLLGKRHKSASEKLKARSQMLQSLNSLASVELETGASEEMATAMAVGGDLPDKPSKNIQEWNCPICQVTTTNEMVFISHLQGKKHDAASWKLKANNMLHSENSCSMKMGAPKEVAVATVIVGRDLPGLSPTKNIQEWTCPICQVTSTNEAVFISHLQGRKHKTASEKLKAKNLMVQNENSPAKIDEQQEMEAMIVAGGNLPCETTSKNVLQEWNCPICQVTITGEASFISHLQGRRHEATSKMLKAKNSLLGSENIPDSVETGAAEETKAFKVAVVDLPVKASIKDIQKEWTCPICQVTATSEAAYISHLQGREHEAASEKLKAENLMLQGKNFLDSMETGACQEMLPASEASRSLPDELIYQKGWTSASPACQVITANEADHISHLQGRHHDNACQTLKMKNPLSEITGFPSLETCGPLENIEMVKATIAGQAIPEQPDSRSAQDECTSSMCMIKTSNETDCIVDLISHFQGQEYDAYEKLKAVNPSLASVSLPKNTEQEATKPGNQLEDLKSRFIEIRDSVWHCTICNIMFNSEKNIESHVTGRKHLARTRELNGDGSKEQA